MKDNLSGYTAATRLKVLIFLRIRKVEIVFHDQSGLKALQVGGGGVGAETVGSSNRSGDGIDMEAVVRSCAVTIAKTMHLAVVLTLSFLTAGDCDLLRDSVHVTSAAARPNNDLWCYKCRAEEADDRCADLRHNNSTLIHKCHNERRMCMVKRFAYTTSTENSTTALKMWALERTCTKHCEPGCIVIGERTKLYACTSCCTTSLCNYGSGAKKQTFHLIISASMFLLTLIIYN